MTKKISMDIQKRKQDPDIYKMFVPRLPTSLFNFTEKLWKILKHEKISAKHEKENTGSYIWKNDELALSKVSLEEQLQAWKENPIWLDDPLDIKVNVPRGSLCNLSVKVNIGLPPDAVYNIVTDPDNKRVFKNIKEVISRKVLVDDGSRQVVEVEQAALWKFLWWSGTLSVHVLVDQNREDHTMQFKQLKTGFMNKFEGCWRVEPLLVDEETCWPFKPTTLQEYYNCTNGKGRIGSKVSLEQLVQPAFVPPPPISWYLRSITAKTTEMLMNDLLAETARLRGTSENSNRKHPTYHQVQGNSDETNVDELHDIKARWVLRRRNAKQRHRKLSLNLTSSASV